MNLLFSSNPPGRQRPDQQAECELCLSQLQMFAELPEPRKPEQMFSSDPRHKASAWGRCTGTCFLSRRLQDSWGRSTCVPGTQQNSVWSMSSHVGNHLGRSLETERLVLQPGSHLLPSGSSHLGVQCPHSQEDLGCRQHAVCWGRLLSLRSPGRWRSGTDCSPRGRGLVGNEDPKGGALLTRPCWCWVPACFVAFLPPCPGLERILFDLMLQPLVFCPSGGVDQHRCLELRAVAPAVCPVSFCFPWYLTWGHTCHLQPGLCSAPCPCLVKDCSLQARGPEDSGCSVRTLPWVQRIPPHRLPQ